MYSRDSEVLVLRRAMNCVSHKKLLAKKAMDRDTKRLHGLLAEQREHSELLQTSCKVDEAEVIDDQAEEQLKGAYETLALRVSSVISAITEVRELERRLHPKELVRPAVIALAVSAPSSTWSLDTWVHAPMPQLAAVVESVFKAAYSNPETEGGNRLKRTWGDDKKNGQNKKRRAESSQHGRNEEQL